MGRIARGWSLTKQSWAIVRADRTLLVFPVIAAISELIVLAMFIAAGVALSSASSILAIIVFAVGAYVLIVVSTTCSVALCACANRAMEGHDTTVAEGFAAARARTDAILGWAGVQLVVSALIALLRAVLREAGGNLIAALVGGLANLAWAVASFFVVPAIAIDGLGPRAALKRSTDVVRAKWGEGVTGSAAIGGLLTLFVFLPAIALIGGGVALMSSVAPLGGLLIAAGVLVLLGGIVVQTALGGTFKVALYRFASEDTVLGGFDRDSLERAFVPRRRRGFLRG